ncbi:Tat binding protein 1-interacting protein-domain-containing protein [Circinella umbellata]|nr:Tat binding protein 1-interacting protein-domain-containing protein [Circinella umbellata]
MSKKKLNAEEEVCDYMRKVNRPYNARKYPKATIVKILDRFIDQNIIYSKTYGKTIIYSVKQDKENEMNTKEQQEIIDKQFDELYNEDELLSKDIIIYEKQLKQLKLEPRNNDATELIPKLIEKNNMIQAHMNQLKSNTILLSNEGKQNIDSEYNLMRKEWRIRRKIGRDMFNTITENLPGKLNEFKEQLGIEDDSISYEDSFSL